jgi:hypothetical protein
MKYLVTTPFFNYDKKGNAKPITAGTLITKKQYGALTPQKQAKCEAIQPQINRVDWLQGEVATILASYVGNYDVTTGEGQTTIREDYHATHGDRHDSPNFIIGQLRFIDRSNRANDGFRHVTRMVADMAVLLDPERFMTFEEAKAISDTIEG